jgi:hypothetical protein
MSNNTLSEELTFDVVLYECRATRNADHQEQTRSRGDDDFLLGR